MPQQLRGPAISMEPAQPHLQRSHREAIKSFLPFKASDNHTQESEDLLPRVGARGEWKGGES